jgi:DNA modification methylase
MAKQSVPLIKATSPRSSQTKTIGKEKRLTGSLLERVVQLSIDALVINPRNARKHSKEQLHRLEACIRTHGFLVPILIDVSRNVVLGHGRILAARAAGMTEVPTLTVSGLTATQIRTFAIAENRLCDLAGWDNDMLRIEMKDLLDMQVDIEETAFSSGAVDLLIDGGGHQGSADDDIPPSLPSGESVSQEGDLWQLGRHRLLCGDATQARNYKLLLGDLKAGVVFTDPPFNVKVDGHVGGLGGVRHREFAMASGEMSPAEFTRFLTTVFVLLGRHSRRGSIHFICMDWRHLREILAAGDEVYSEFKNLCVWNKDNAGMGSLYRSKHELVLVFQNGSGRFQNNVCLGAGGRYRTNVWDYPGMSSIRQGRQEDLAMHPTVKPLALVADAIRDCSKRNDLVLDPFVGSGTTILAADRAGRVCAAMEIDGAYVDVAIRRWETATNVPAALCESGETFEAVKQRRSSHTEGNPQGGPI